jgi:mannose-6-phosphate isomerase-like protein (cupin superfamily)
MGIRRVVTGHRNGKAVFVSDGEVEPLTMAALPGTEFWRLWGADTAPHFPDEGSEPAQPTYFPPVGGFRFGIVTVAPAAAPGASDAAALAELEAKLPGLLAYMEPDEPGMHTTATIDFEVLLSGELVLELDDGAEVTLRPGDTVVQNGTRHRWINRSSEPAQFAVFICGARHGRFNA